MSIDDNNHLQKSRPAILVVDDKPENLLAMEQALSELDAEIICTDSGRKSLEFALARRFAVILLDVQMPEVDGLEIAELLGGNHQTASIPVIFITASGQHDHFHKAYRLGVADFLQKPVNKNVLLSKVRTFLLLEQQRTMLESLTRNLKRSNEHQALLLNRASEGIVGFDGKGRVTFANPEACRLFALDEQDLQNEKISSLFHHDNTHHHCFNDVHGKKIAKRVVTAKKKMEISREDGTTIPVELKISTQLDENGVPEGGVVLFQDITRREKQKQQLVYEARHDSLTGLANRTSLEEFLEASIARNQRRQKHTGILFLDLDGFKEVNDTFGHEYGDQLLSHVAARLGRCIRKGELITRVGGDEFVIVLDEVACDSDLCRVAEKVIHTLERPFHLNQHTVTVGVSIGLALWPGHGQTPQALLKFADKGMYMAKRQGGNRFCMYEPD